MYVKHRMTVDPVTVHPENTVSEVLDLMKDNTFHRLPVTKDGKLVGLITQTTIQANTPSHLTTLSIHEMNYLLSKTTVNDIMIKKVATANPNMTMEEAADIMEKKDIGCLPVVGEANVLLGILTTGDILHAFVELMGHNLEGSTRISGRFSENKVGVLADFTKLFAENKISVTHASIVEDGYHIRCDSTDQKKLVKMLEDKGYTVDEIG